MIITQEIYEKAKRKLHIPSDDSKVAREFNFSESTARKIRCTKNFGEYVTRTKNAHRRAVRRENMARKRDILSASDFPKETECFEEKTTLKGVLSLAATVFILALVAIALVGAVKFIIWCFGA